MYICANVGENVSDFEIIQEKTIKSYYVLESSSYSALVVVHVATYRHCEMIVYKRVLSFTEI